MTERKAWRYVVTESDTPGVEVGQHLVAVKKGKTATWEYMDAVGREPVFTSVTARRYGGPLCDTCRLTRHVATAWGHVEDHADAPVLREREPEAA